MGDRQVSGLDAIAADAVPCQRGGRSELILFLGEEILALEVASCLDQSRYEDNDGDYGESGEKGGKEKVKSLPAQETHFATHFLAGNVRQEEQFGARRVGD